MTGNRLSRFVTRGLAAAGIAMVAFAGSALAGDDRWPGHQGRGWHHGHNKHDHSNWRHNHHRHNHDHSWWQHRDRDRSDWWRERRQRERAAWWREQRQRERYSDRRNSWWSDKSRWNGYQAYDGGRVMDTKCPKYC